jgi:hypothetical protein
MSAHRLARVEELIDETIGLIRESRASSRSRLAHDLMTIEFIADMSAVANAAAEEGGTLVADRVRAAIAVIQREERQAGAPSLH